MCLHIGASTSVPAERDLTRGVWRAFWLTLVQTSTQFGQLNHSPASTDSRLCWLDWTPGTFSLKCGGLDPTTRLDFAYFDDNIMSCDFQCFTSLLTQKAQWNKERFVVSSADFVISTLCEKWFCCFCD